MPIFQARAIPTTYAETHFRSRLEAKWAAFFDELEWPWIYEPFDLGGYVPDFLLTFAHRQILAEVKPATDATRMAYAEELERRLPYAVINEVIPGGEMLLLGVAPTFAGAETECCCDVVGTHWENSGPPGPGDPGCLCPGAGVLFECVCGVGLSNEPMTYFCRRCGHGDGGHLHRPLERSVIRGAWARACNASQWMARA